MSFQNVKTILNLWTGELNLAIGCILPIYCLVSKPDGHLFKAQDDYSSHFAFLPPVSHAPYILASVLFPHLDCPFQAFSAYWNYTSKILSDATSPVKPYPVLKGQSEALSLLCCLSFVPLLRYMDFILLCVLTAYVPHCPRRLRACRSRDIPNVAPQLLSEWKDVR